MTFLQLKGLGLICILPSLMPLMRLLIKEGHIRLKGFQILGVDRLVLLMKLSLHLKLKKLSKKQRKESWSGRKQELVPDLHLLLHYLHFKVSMILLNSHRHLKTVKKNATRLRDKNVSVFSLPKKCIREKMTG